MPATFEKNLECSFVAAIVLPVGDTFYRTMRDRKPARFSPIIGEKNESGA
jgi:hypothetical protein